MTNLFVMETALYILLLSFYLCLGLNKTIRSSRSLRISFLSVLLFEIQPHIYHMYFNSDLNLVWSLSSLVGYLLSWCPVQIFQQNSEIILLISRRIFQLRSALVASTTQDIWLTSSLDPSGLNQHRLPPFRSVKNFGIRIRFDLTLCGLWPTLCLGPLFGTTLCFSKTKGNLPSYCTVWSVAVWFPRELVFVGVRNQAASDTFHDHLSLDTHRRSQLQYHWKLFHISSGLMDLTEWNIASQCFSDPALLLISMLHQLEFGSTAESSFTGSCTIWGWVVQTLPGSSSSCRLGWTPRSHFIIAFLSFMLNVFQLCNVQLIYNL